jgi:hypothetical protein
VLGVITPSKRLLRIETSAVPVRAPELFSRVLLCSVCMTFRLVVLCEDLF